MLGGYQILDLRNIGLTLGASQVSITDAEILSQLRNLRNYIEKGHDYGKALNNSPKPVLIRYRDAKNNEKLEVSAFASVTSSNNSLTYDIRAKGLQIEVVFEEKTDDDGNKYYDIKTAKYHYSENESVEGDMSIGGDLEVEGDADITGDAEVGGDLSVTDDAQIGGDLEVTGDAKLFENIVDKDGHKRFVDGDITMATGTVPTKVYGKWSLSGTHLMFVLCISANNGDVIAPGTLTERITIPEWVEDKLVPIYGDNISRMTLNLYADDTSSQAVYVYLQKKTAGIFMYMSALTLDKNRVGRIEFDLLIDNE